MSEAGKRIPVIMVHGGAWAIPQELTSRTLTGVELAARRGHDILQNGGSALDAVEGAIRVLENDQVFDAGYGSVLTSGGTVEMDAAMMCDDGRPNAGGVAAVSCFRNPISVARRVLESEHVLLVGRGAEAFGSAAGAEVVASETMVTDQARAEWKRFREYGDVVETLFGHDTVGAVALDGEGCVAAGTSTGGITYKKPGRVGDSPIVGAGLWAEMGKGAVSTTGHGESILLCGLARGVVDGIGGKGVGEVCGEAVRRMRRRTGGCGGVVCVTWEGELGRAFSTERMAWAGVGRDGVMVSGIDADE